MRRAQTSMASGRTCLRGAERLMLARGHWLGGCILEAIVKGKGWETEPRKAIECQAEELKLGHLSPGDPLQAVALVLVRKITLGNWEGRVRMTGTEPEQGRGRLW